MPKNTPANTATDRDDISRNPGTAVRGFRVGGGYRGKRDDQDEAVKHFAVLLAEEFPHNIDIRYNTNRLSGGAWLIDGKRNAQVGLRAKLLPPESYGNKLSNYYDSDSERHEKPTPPRYKDPKTLNLVFSVNISAPVIPEEMCNNMTDRENRTSYLTKEFQTVEETWDWFTETSKYEHIHDPPENGKSGVEISITVNETE